MCSSDLPTTWDETKVLEARVGDYLITARKTGNDWYVGGMTDWSSRPFTLNLDFLDPGIYEAELCKDGINADTYPADYVITRFTIERATPFSITMAPGGGFVLKLKKRD